MGKKEEKKKKKKAQSKTRSWVEVAAELDVDPRRVAAYARLMDIEDRLYQLWEQRSQGQMDWVGEALRELVDEDSTLWLAAVGDKVAALGGHLELVAVFPDQTLTLLLEPGLNTPGAPPDDA
jgi:hypothetical protein